MNTETYRQLRDTSGICADEYMACIEHWLRSDQDPDLGRDCSERVLKFKQAVEQELSYLRSRPRSDHVIRRIAENEEFLTVIARDISRFIIH